MTTQTKTTCLHPEALAKGWRKMKLGEVADVLNGYAFSSRAFIPKSDGATPVFKMGNIKEGGGIQWTGKEDYIPENQERSLTRFLTEPEDILMCMTDMKANVRLLGYSAFIKNEKFLVNQRVGRIKAKRNLAYARFLFYYLNSPDYISFIRSTARSGVQVNLTTEEIRESPLLIPDITIQKRIADILSAFDDKIELNNKISAALEQMAQAIFKEWFVKFKFPGHEKVKMVDSELGKIPEGWEVKSLDEIANFLNGLALQKYRPNNTRDTLPVIKIREMNNGIDNNTELASSDIDEKYKVNAGDILFSWSGSLELMRWVGRTGALNQHLFKATSERYPEWFIFYWIQKHLPFFRVIAAGKATSMGHIQRRHLSEALVRVPSSVVMTVADKTISPMFDNILALRLENQKLAALRDLLLPKLMSGEIRAKI